MEKDFRFYRSYRTNVVIIFFFFLLLLISRAYLYSRQHADPIRAGYEFKCKIKLVIVVKIPLAVSELKEKESSLMHIRYYYAYTEREAARKSGAHIYKRNNATVIFNESFKHTKNNNALALPSNVNNALFSVAPSSLFGVSTFFFFPCSVAFLAQTR